jgi:hypothetical protein
MELALAGSGPLMMDHMPDEVIESALLMGKRDPADRESNKYQRAIKKIYTGDDGEPVIPMLNITACVKNGGKQVKIGRAGITKANGETKLYAIMTLAGDNEENPTEATLFTYDASDKNNPDKWRASLIENFDPQKSCKEGDWTTDLKKGNQGQAGVAVGIVRPKFPRWGIKITATVDLEAVDGLTHKHVLELFNKAGTMYGLCSFRPEKGGPFGMFKITRVVIKDAEGKVIKTAA